MQVPPSQEVQRSPRGAAAAAVGLEEDDVGLAARWNLGLTPAWPRAPSPILWPCAPAEPLPLAPICLWPSPQLVPPQLLWDPKKARRRLAPRGCPQVPTDLPPPVAQARTGGSAQPRHCIFGVLLVWTNFGPRWWQLPTRVVVAVELEVSTPGMRSRGSRRWALVSGVLGAAVVHSLAEDAAPWPGENRARGSRQKPAGPRRMRSVPGNCRTSEGHSSNRA